MSPTASELLHGGVDPLPERVPLVAGPISVVYEAGDLRSIRLNGVDVINRIYGAIRDDTWATVPGRISELVMEASPDSFRISYLSEHVAGPVDFAWRAEIAGTSGGEISFVFAGEARSAFARNRIGLCILHPLATCAGRDATVRLPDGTVRPARFPIDVSIEQPVVGFEEFVGLRWPVAADVDADLSLEGDIFETEDQRNWIDPTFKTFSTPLRLPRPVLLATGTRVRQRVVLRTIAARPAPGRAAISPASSPPEVARTPSIGLALTQGHVDAADVERLKTLGIAHVRVDLAREGGWERRLGEAVALASAVGCDLELALDVGEGHDDWLHNLAAALPRSPAVARVLVYGEGALVTTPHALDAVSAHLVSLRQDLGPIASGTRQDLFQVHMLKPPAAALTSWGMHPQAHAVDATSIAETPRAAGDQVRSMRRRVPASRIAISPLRFHPRAADPRLHSLFGAAWTLAILAELAAEGVESVTALETSGPRGVVAGALVAPAFHPIADLAEFRGAPAAGYRPAELVTGILVGGDDRAALLVANLARDTRTVDLPAGFAAESFRVLDSSSVVESMNDPVEFRTTHHPPSPDGRLTLSPFSTARLDGKTRV